MLILPNMNRNDQIEENFGNGKLLLILLPLLLLYKYSKLKKELNYRMHKVRLVYLKEGCWKRETVLDFASSSTSL